VKVLEVSIDNLFCLNYRILTIMIYTKLKTEYWTGS